MYLEVAGICDSILVVHFFRRIPSLAGIQGFLSKNCIHNSFTSPKTGEKLRDRSITDSNNDSAFSNGKHLYKIKLQGYRWRRQKLIQETNRQLVGAGNACYRYPYGIRSKVNTSSILTSNRSRNKHFFYILMGSQMKEMSKKGEKRKDKQTRIRFIWNLDS